MEGGLHGWSIIVAEGDTALIDDTVMCDGYDDDIDRCDDDDNVMMINDGDDNNNNDDDDDVESDGINCTCDHLI